MAVAEIAKAALEVVKEVARETGEKVVETVEEVAKEKPSSFPEFFKDIKMGTKSFEFGDLNSMKEGLGKSYSEIKKEKPLNSPNIAKWFDNNGKIGYDKVGDKTEWTYKDETGRKVTYIDGYPDFPAEAKHPIIDDIDIGKFSGDRNLDKKKYLEKLREQYGLSDCPDGYDLHHDSKNGNMQLVQSDWHKEFTHAGGHSIFKEV